MRVKQEHMIQVLNMLKSIRVQLEHRIQVLNTLKIP